MGTRLSLEAAFRVRNDTWLAAMEVRWPGLAASRAALLLILAGLVVFGGAACARNVQPDRAAAEAALLRATDLHGAGYVQDAEQGYREAVTLDPSYAFAYYRLGVLSAQRGRLGTAEAHFRRAIRLDSNFARPYVELALLRLRTRDYAAAIPLLETAARLAPGDGEILERLDFARRAARDSGDGAGG
jgi:tetratricopeptide (TPR) repeat protein